jgi:hypothetical protein
MLFNFLFSVSPCDNNPCENNGTCSVDVNGNATCTCDGNWNGTYCEGMLFTRQIINSSHGFNKTSIF